MQFHKSYISTVQYFKRPFLINEVQYRSPDSPGCVLREGIKCYGSWKSWNNNFPILSAVLLLWESRGGDQQNACSTEGYSWQGGTLAKWHFGCSCFHLSLRDHGSAIKPIQAPAWADSMHPQITPPLLPPRSSVTSMRWEFVFAFQHPWQLLSSLYLSRWKQDCTCFIFTKDLPLPHVLPVHALNSDVSSSGHLSEAQSLQQQHPVKQQIYWPSGRADTGKKTQNVGWTRELVIWTLALGRDDSVSATLSCAPAGTPWKRWLFLILSARGGWHPFIQITLFPLPHSGQTGRNTVSPFIVTALDLPGILIAEFLFCFVLFCRNLFYWFGSLTLHQHIP